MNGFLAAQHPLVIAHRGASRYAPENTLAAFRLAVEQGADAVELDAKLSADGEVVVIHDPTTDRTTGFRGEVRQLSLRQLKSLDAGSFFSAQFSGEPVPTLAEVFEAVGEQVLINVELTNYTSPGDALVEKVVALVQKYHLEERVLFSSFHPLNLFRAQRLLPQVPTAILALPGRAGWWARAGWMRRVSPWFVHPYFTDVTARYIAHQHTCNRKVNVWTVNAIADMTHLVEDGVDGLITDDPPAARQVFAA